MVWVAKGFPQWQQSAVDLVKQAWTGEAVDDKKIKESLVQQGLIKDKRYMPFIAQLKKRIAQFGFDEAIDRQITFDEVETLAAAMPYTAIMVAMASDSVVRWAPIKRTAHCVVDPGSPSAAVDAVCPTSTALMALEASSTCPAKARNTSGSTSTGRR